MTFPIVQIDQAATALLPELIEIRRHLHMHPELSFREYQTARFIEQKLTEIGIPFQSQVAGTGIVAIIKGQNPDKHCIALRADMDALPIEEANDISYCSQNKGVMHACGHDVHTTCLIGAAKILNSLKADFEGSIKLIFQPGEEQSPGGASLMIAGGVLEHPGVEAIFGLHVDPSLPSGTVGFRPGQYMASADEIHIKIKGKSGHAALPHLAVDPISIAALIITALQQIVSRKANPLTPSVLTFGKISGGQTTNIIPEEVEILGTFRTFDEQWRQQALQLIDKTVRNIAAANDARAEVTFPPGYPSVYNHPRLTGAARSLAENVLGADHVTALGLRMTAEDFAFYGQKIPACFFRLGTSDAGTKYSTSVHHAGFDIHEPAMITGVKIMSLLALNALKFTLNAPLNTP